MALFVALVGACGGGGNNAANSGTNSQTTPAGECQTDDDCPGASSATFNNPDNAVCTSSQVRGNYCSECIYDSQCMPGFACRDATYCEELPPCTTGSDCSDKPGAVHDACIANFCDRCLDDADCDDEQVCYSAKCADRATVDPTCLDASCEGPCEIQYDGSGAATGIACVQ